MADKAALFKTAMKQVCARAAYSVTFMAKWNADLPGSSGHLHQSLCGEDGATNVFYDAGDPHSLSAHARHYLGGQIALMPELTALYSPTVNSYKRYVPGRVGAAHRVAGESRTAPAPSARSRERRSATRLEYRQTAADINPYIAIATSLAAGLWGIEQRSEPPPPAAGDASRARAGLAPLPRTLREANARARRRARPRASILGEAVRRPLRAHARLGVPPVRARRDRLGAQAVLRGNLTGRTS